ncbi:hypothetical protein HPB48_004202 [Haemaphysalis longicornis]|uniref:Uncharacterized protein n=1 Tax=Haemaphysalis longicornis TaxID=44386 RepID=A0A9J6GWE2_HAELO|nr:hypothetical protein HPB48_004202 [Haemaphysalis longicornis]
MLKKTTQQITRLIRKITRKKSGMIQEDTLRLRQALVVSRVAYSLPYHRLNKQENDQIETILNRCCKTAIGLPQCTATSKVQKLGIKELLLRDQRSHTDCLKTKAAIH